MVQSVYPGSVRAPKRSRAPLDWRGRLSELLAAPALRTSICPLYPPWHAKLRCRLCAYECSGAAPPDL